MRRAGVPQVVRMRITGHRTDSMERRYNIVDIEDIKSAREMMQAGRKERYQGYLSSATILKKVSLRSNLGDL